MFTPICYHLIKIRNLFLANRVTPSLPCDKVVIFVIHKHDLTVTCKTAKCQVCDLCPVGSIPTWLQGTLLRNGPGLFSVGDSEYNHWFDGLSLIHSFTFSDGKTGKIKGPVFIWLGL